MSAPPNNLPGKPGIAPCGCQGFHVTANYVTCPKHDRLATPAPSDGIPTPIAREPTLPLCRECGSTYVRAWGVEFNHEVTGETFWTCRSCGKSFFA